MTRRVLAVVVSIALFSPAVCAEVIPSLDVARLTNQSNTVAVGRVVSVSTRDSVTSVARSSPAGRATAVLEVIRYLKGPLDAARLTCSFEGAVRPLADYGLPQNEYRLFFLSRNDGACRFADRHYLSLPAALIDEEESGSPLDRVSSVLAAVLDSPTIDAPVKGRLIFDVGSVPLPQLTDALRRASRHSGRVVALGAASALFLQGDLSGLPTVVAALLEEDSGWPPLSMDQARSALARVADSRAITLVARLLDAQDARTRESAAQALRNTRSELAIEPLVRALDDSDTAVQYTAVIALAELTKDDAHAPSVTTFSGAPAGYLKYWKEWAARRGLSR